MTVPVGYELLGTVLNPLGIKIGGEQQINFSNLNRAIVAQESPVLSIVNLYMSLYLQD